MSRFNKSTCLFTVVVMVDVSDRWMCSRLDFEVLKCLARHPSIPAVLVLNKVFPPRITPKMVRGPSEKKGKKQGLYPFIFKKWSLI